MHLLTKTQVEVSMFLAHDAVVNHSEKDQRIQNYESRELGVSQCWQPIFHYL